jgi:hypothetical protein
VLRSRRDRELPADHPRIERTSFFPQIFNVKRKRLLSVRCGLVKSVALCVQARKIRSINVVTPLVLGGKDKLDLARLIHEPRIGATPAADKPRPHAILHHVQ